MFTMLNKWEIFVNQTYLLNLLRMRKKKSDRVKDMLEDLAIRFIIVFWVAILAETIAYFIVY